MVEDHPLFRLGLRAALMRRVPDAVIVEAGSAAEGRRVLMDGATTDLAFVDLKLGADSGLTLLEHVPRPNYPLRLVVVTSADPREADTAVARLGAFLVLPKETPVSEILDRALSGLEPATWHMSSDPGLTPREVHVLELVALGLTNREIGERLGTATETVKAQVASVLAKLGVNNRTEAALWVARSSWAPPNG